MSDETLDDLGIPMMTDVELEAFAVSLVAEVRSLRAENEQLRDDAERTFPATWTGFRAFLDEFYPDDIFPDDDRDLGPSFVVAARRLDDMRVEREDAREQLGREMAIVDDMMRDVANIEAERDAARERDSEARRALPNIAELIRKASASEDALAAVREVIAAERRLITQASNWKSVAYVQPVVNRIESALAAADRESQEPATDPKEKP